MIELIQNNFVELEPQKLGFLCVSQILQQPFSKPKWIQLAALDPAKAS